MEFEENTEVPRKSASLSRHTNHTKTRFILFTPLTPPWTPSLLTPDSESSEPFTFSDNLGTRAGVWVSSGQRNWRAGDLFRVVGIRERILAPSGLVSLISGNVEDPPEQVKILFGLAGLQPYEELLAGFSYLMYEHLPNIPQLILQFRLHYSVDEMQCEDASAVYQVVDAVLARTKSWSAIKGVLMLIGTLELPMALPSHKLQSTFLILDSVEKRTIRELAEEKECYLFLIKGLAQVMALDCFNLETYWKSVLASYFHAPDLLIALAERPEMKDSSAIYIWEMSSRVSQSVQIDVLTASISHTHHFPTLFHALLVLSKLPGNRSKWEPLFCNSFNLIFSQNQLKIDSFRLLIQRSKELTSNDIRLLQKTALSAKLLTFPYGTLDTGELSQVLSCTEIFTIDRRCDLFWEFVRKFNYPIAAGIRILHSASQERVTSVWTTWVQSLSHLPTSIQIKATNSTLSDILDLDIWKSLAEIATTSLFSKAASKEAFLDLSGLIVKCKALKSSYVTHWRREIATEKPGFLLYSLAFAIKKLQKSGESKSFGEQENEESKFYGELCKAATDRLPDLTDEEVALSIYQSNWNGPWELLLYYRRYFEKTSAYVRRVTSGIRAVATDLISKSTPLQRLELVYLLDDQGKSRLIRLLEQEVEVKQRVKEALSSSLALLADIYSTIDQFEELLTRLLHPLPWAAGLSSIVQSFRVAALSSTVQGFSMPAHIAGLKAVAIQLKPFFSSLLFQHFLRSVNPETEIRENGPAFVAIKACNQAKERMFAGLNSIKQAELKGKLSNLLLLFEPVGLNMRLITAEIEILEVGAAWNGYESWKEAFKLYTGQNELLSHCKLLSGLQQLGLFEDDAILMTCKRYLRLLSWANSAEVGFEDFETVASNSEYHSTHLEDIDIGTYNSVSRETHREIYPDNQAHSCLTVLEELYRSRELLSFLDSVTDTILTHLKESVNDYDDTAVTADIINDLEVAWGIREGLKACRGNYRSLLTCVAQLACNEDERQLKEVYTSVKSCQEHLNDLSLLLREVENKGEARMSQIQCIYQDSEVEFSRRDDSYDVSVKYAVGTLIIIDVSHASKTISAGELAELEERAALTQKHASSDMLQAFLSLSRSIRLIQARLTALLTLGYPEDEAQARHFRIKSGLCEELSAFERDLINTQRTYKAGLVRLYENYHIMTYFYGRQFWTLDRFLRGLEGGEREAEGLLRYAQVVPSKDAFSSLRTPISPLAQLEALAKVLSSSSIVQSIRSEPAFVPPDSLRISPSACFIYVQCECALSGIATVCMQGGHQLPQAHQLLLGNRETMWEEVQAFLYRCAGDNRKGLYVFAGVSKLPLRVQIKAKKTLIKLTEEKAVPFHIAFISDLNESIIGDYLAACKWPETALVPASQLITDLATLQALVLRSDPHFCLVKSALPGSGKTAYIKAKARELGRDLSYVSLAGDLSAAGLCRALGRAQQGGLHLRLGLVEDTELISDFFMSLSLVRTWVHTDCRVYLPLAVIYLEIANLQPSLIEKVSFLRYFPIKLVQFRAEDAQIQSGALFYACKYLDLLSSHNIDILELADSGEPSAPHSLLDRYYFDVISSPRPIVTYRSLNAFADVFATLAGHMEEGPFSLSVLRLAVAEAKAKRDTKLTKSLAGLRTEAITCTLHTAIEATSTSVSRVHREQLEALGLEPGLYQRPDFSQQKHFAAIFIEDGSLVPIYCKVSEVPEAFVSLFSTQAHLLSKLSSKVRTRPQPNLPDYQFMTDSDLKSMLFSIFPRVPDPSSPIATEELLRELEYTAQFVMTPDTYYKMMMIYLRAIAHQPVVIMGETGCGKTFLVRYFVRIVLKARLLLFSLHAGMTNAELDTIIVKIRQEAGRTQGLLWVFLDEFNTTLCMSRICDVLCERRDGEEEIAENVRFVVACNPLRKRGEAYDSSIGLKRETQVQSQQVYMVNPLPENIMEYVWDFGSLSKEDSKAYIRAMLQAEASLVQFVELVYMAHEYYKDSGDWVGASLRDVVRFTKLYKWFKKTLPMRIANPSARTRPLPLPLDQAAGVLAFCICYYLRLHCDTTRFDFLARCNRFSSFPRSRILQCIAWDQDDLLGRMQLPLGTAVNSALKENVTTLFHCVYNQIPVFLCGKPGCSKSLSIRTLNEACRGGKSKDLFFQKQQEFVLRYFQGSMSCTSQGILEVFKRAEKYLTTPNLLPVVVFDEIALAEQSHENPLKALHSLLEVEAVKVGFIAISNWRLDAAKMNRVLYLARPDPTKEDLKTTAQCLADAILTKPVANWCNQLLISLAESYFTCQEKWELSRRSVYGLRDFYGLVRQVAGEIQRKGYSIPRENVFESVYIAIERNFGGDTYGKSELLQAFQSTYQSGYAIPRYCSPVPLPALITANISDNSSRYLLLIGRNDVNSLILQQANIPCHFLVGSSLPGDYQSDECIQRSLTEVLLYMEKPVCLVFAHMDQSYGALYDLFNQSFAYSQDMERKYCRVALGPRLNPRCMVNAEFRVVVMMQEEQVRETEAPFLNRFEKQIVNIDNLLEDTHRDILAGLEQWVASLFTLPSGRKVELPIASVLPLYTPNHYFPLIAYTHSSLKAAKSAIIETASDDIIAISAISQLPEADKLELRQLWEMSHCLSLTELLAGEAGEQLIVFTHSREEVHGEGLAIGNLDAFHSEQEVMEELRRFGAGKKHVLVMEINIAEGAKHLFWLQYVLSKAKCDFQRSKILLIMARYSRSNPPKYPISLFPAWTLRHLDHFNTNYPLYFDLSNEEMKQRALCDLEGQLAVLTREAYESILFSSETLRSEDILEHIKTMVETIPKMERLFPAIKAKVAEALEAANYCDWRESVLCDRPKDIVCPDLETAISLVQAQRLRQAYTVLIISIEHYRAAESLYTSAGDLLDAWVKAFDRLELHAIQPIAASSVNLPFKTRLTTPFILMDWKDIKAAYRDFSSQERSLLYQFSTQLRSSSVLPLPLQSLPLPTQAYLNDLIQLLSEDLNIEPSHLELMQCLGNTLADKEKDLWERVWAVMQGAKMMELIVEVARIWENMGRGELVGRLKETLAGNMERSPMQRIAESIESLSLEIVTPDALGSTLLSSSPSSFFTLLRLLFLKLKTIANSTSLVLTKLENLDFWMRLLPVACQLGTSSSALATLIAQGKELDTEELPYVYNDSFIEVLVNLMENSEKRDLRLIAAFKLKYFSILLNRDLRYIQQIATVMAKQTEFIPCPAIIDKIVNITELNDISSLLASHSRGEDLSNTTYSFLEPALYPPFSTLLSDSLLTYLSNRPEYGFSYLTTYSDEFHFASTNFRVDSDSPQLRELILATAIRSYADHYCIALVQGNCTDLQTQAMAVAMRSPDFGSALRLYCLKRIKRLQEGSYEDFYAQISMRVGLEWIEGCDWKAGEGRYVPLLSLMKDAYSSISIQLKRAIKYNLPINSLSEPQERLAFLVSFWMEAKGNDVFSLERWLETSSLQPTALLAVANLASSRKLLALMAGNAQQTESIYLFLSIIAAYSAVENPFSRLIFDEKGEVWSNLTEQFTRVFKYGAESNRQYDYLRPLIQQLEGLKEPLHSLAATKCPRTPVCPYLSLRSTCPSVCPLCAAPIPANFALYMTCEQALSAAKAAISHCEATESCIYVAREKGMARGQMPGRALKTEEGFRVLHLWLNATLAMSQLAGFVRDEELQKMVYSSEGVEDWKEHFKATIRVDFAALEALIGEKVYTWLENLLSRIPSFLVSSAYSCSNREGRISFETGFESTLIQHFLPLSEQDLARYRQSCQFAASDWENMIEEISVKPDFPSLDLFRCRQIGNFEDIREVEEKYAGLKLFVERKRDFYQLKCLYPLLTLTKALIERFNHRISRQKAKEHIKETLAGEPALLALFQAAKKQWNCHLSSQQFQWEGSLLPPRKVNWKDPLGWYLPDLKGKEGLYVPAALLHLSNIQNALLAAAKLDPPSVPLENVPKEHLILLNVDSKKQFGAFWTNHPDYGYGEKVIYHWEGLEEKIWTRLCNAWKLTPNWMLFQYEFELLSGETASLMDTIATNIPQSPLSAGYLKEVRSAFAGNQKEQLSAAFTALCSLLAHVAYIRSAPSDPLSSLAHFIPHFHQLSVPLSSLLDLPLGHLLDLYSFIEDCYFEHVKNLFSDRRKGEITTKGKEQIDNLRRHSVPGMPPLEALITALKRLIMRCLLSRTDETTSLQQLILRKDLWSPLVLSSQMKARLKDALGNFSTDTCYNLYESLIRLEDRPRPSPEKAKSASKPATKIKKYN